MTGPTTTLLAALLPTTWPDREPLLDAAGRLDRADAASRETLLHAWHDWRSTGELPSSAPLRDLVAALVTVLGGVGPELRLRPQEAM